MSDPSWPPGDERSKLIAAAYESADRADVRAVAVVEYRCRQGCLLLHTWRSPTGLLYYQPAYRLSPERADAETVESARVKRTTDGYRRWRARGGVLEELRDWGDSVGLEFQCDHLKHYRSAPMILADADAAEPGKPTRRSFS